MIEEKDENEGEGKERRRIKRTEEKKINGEKEKKGRER